MTQLRQYGGPPHLLEQLMESSAEPTGPPSATCNRCGAELVWRYRFYNQDGTLHYDQAGACNPPTSYGLGRP